jgi:hypothetical protein
LTTQTPHLGLLVVFKPLRTNNSFFDHKNKEIDRIAPRDTNISTLEHKSNRQVPQYAKTYL